MDEDIVVADTNNHRIQIFEKTGDFKYQFGQPGMLVICGLINTVTLIVDSAVISLPIHCCCKCYSLKVKFKINASCAVV